MTGLPKYYHALFLMVFTLISTAVYGLPSTVVQEDSATYSGFREHFDRGAALTSESRFSEAIVELKTALSLAEKIYGRNHRHIVSVLINLGSCSNELRKFDSAEDFYMRAVGILENVDPGGGELASVYNNLGNIFSKTGEFNTAIEYYKYAINIYNTPDQSGPPDYYYLSTLYSNRGSVLQKLGKSQEAIIDLNISIEMKRKYDLPGLHFPHFFLAEVFRQTGQYNQAGNHYQEALSLLEEYNPGRINQRAKYLQAYGLFRTSLMDDAVEGGRLIRQSLDLMLSHYGKEHPDVAQAHITMGKYYILAAQPEPALNSFQEALIALADSSSTGDPTDFQSHDISRYLYLYFKIYQGKAYSLRLQSSIDEDITTMESALKNLEISMNILDRIRIGYQTEESQFLLLENEEKTIEDAIGLAYEICQLQGDEKSVERVFQFSERSKANILRSNLQLSEAMSFGGIPDTLQQMENEYNRNIAMLRELYHEERKKKQPDDRNLHEYERQLLQTGQRKNALVAYMEQEFPDYYRLKYEPANMPVSVIQDQLERNQVIIEYEFADSSIYAFMLSKENLLMKKIPAGINFKRHFDQVISFLTEKRFNTNVTIERIEFSHSSFRLYEVLIAPFEPHIQGKHLIVVPDNELNLIPFEIMLTRSVDAEKADYFELPYLVWDYPVSYASSVPLMMGSRDTRLSWSNNLLGFATKYGDGESNPAEYYSSRRYIRDSLVNIPWSREEVVFLERLIGGAIFLDDSASEYNFKKEAENYDILHLALHTIIDNEEPMFSNLVFAESGSREDNFLTTHEIYNLSLKAKMTTLSSCNTGLGKLQAGEGVISLSRGFQYAGCPSITMSLWEAEDRSGIEIMSQYYRNLKWGMSKQVALRKAKLKFLKSGEPFKTHPYFWAGYMVIGDPGPIYIKWWHKVLILMLVPLFLIGWYFISRK